MKVVDARLLNSERIGGGPLLFYEGQDFSGFLHERDQGRLVRLGYVHRGIPYGPHFVWHADGRRSVEWKSGHHGWLHGPEWAWHPDGTPALDVLHEGGRPVRRRTWDPAGQWVEDASSPCTDLRYPPAVVVVWADDGSLIETPFHDPDPIGHAPWFLQDPSETRVEDLIRQLAPFTRQAAYFVPPQREGAIAALTADLQAKPSVEGWWVLTDALIEVQHPFAEAMRRLRHLLDPTDLEAAFRAVHELSPVAPWRLWLAGWLWQKRAREATAALAQTLGIALPPAVQGVLEKQLDAVGLPPGALLPALVRARVSEPGIVHRAVSRPAAPEGGSHAVVVQLADGSLFVRCGRLPPPRRDAQPPRLPGRPHPEAALAWVAAVKDPLVVATTESSVPVVLEQGRIRLPAAEGGGTVRVHPEPLTWFRSVTTRVGPPFLH